MCGQILADMGAQVVQWVRPAHEHNLTRSFWRAYTLGKSVQVIDWPDGVERLLDRLAEADVLIESESAGFWADLGLSDEEFEARFPALVRVCIRHFGRTGPKSGYASTDLISLAASGHLYVFLC